MLDKNKFPLKLDLQHFGGGGEPNPEENPEGAPEPKGEVLTDEEIAKRIESESDRKLASAKDKWEQEQAALTKRAVEEALAEERRLSKLSKTEQQEEALTQREKDLQERETEIATKLLRSETVDDLQEKNLPSEFADFLLAKDAKSTLENVNTFKKTFDEAVNAAVKEALRQDTPKTGSGTIKEKGYDIAEIARKSRIIK